MDNGQFPTTEQGLHALVEQPESGPLPKRWTQYLDKTPVDPWGQPYMYESSGESIEFYTFGADRQEGGEGDNADLYFSELGHLGSD